jgi:hypothetical protein
MKAASRQRANRIESRDLLGEAPRTTAGHIAHPAQIVGCAVQAQAGSID